MGCDVVEAVRQTCNEGKFEYFKYLVDDPYDAEDLVTGGNAYVVSKAAGASDIRFLKYILKKPYVTVDHFNRRDGESYRLAAYHNRFENLTILLGLGGPHVYKRVRKSRALETAEQRGSKECVEILKEFFKGES